MCGPNKILGGVNMTNSMQETFRHNILRDVIREAILDLFIILALFMMKDQVFIQVNTRQAALSVTCIIVIGVLCFGVLFSIFRVYQFSRQKLEINSSELLYYGTEMKIIPINDIESCHIREYNNWLDRLCKTEDIVIKIKGKYIVFRNIKNAQKACEIIELKKINC